MIAAVSDTYGDSSVITINEIAKPTPNENEFLLAIKCSGVNRTDAGFLTGLPKFARIFYGLGKPKNKVLGCEFAGEVVAVGSAIKNYQVGDKLFGFSDSPFGGHAAYRICNEKEALAKIPTNLNFRQAAALAEGSHYALCDIRAAKLKPGAEVMVYGAGGAIGSAAVQILLAMGHQVTAVCGTHQIEKISALGAHQILDYQKQNFLECPQTFDLVLDAVGKSHFKACVPLLKPNGIYISTELGPSNQNPFLALWHAIMKKKGKRVLFPIPFHNKEDMEYLASLAEQGKFTPLIDRVYPLSEIKEAYDYVLSGEKTGNVIIEMPQV